MAAGLGAYGVLNMAAGLGGAYGVLNIATYRNKRLPAAQGTVGSLFLGLLLPLG